MRLAVENLRAGYGSAEVLHQVGLHLKAGEAMVLFGRNGMGKSTLLKALLGLLDLTSGNVVLGDAMVLGWSTNRIIRMGVAYAPQEEAIFAELSVGENLEAAAMAGRRLDKERRQRVLDYFPILGKRLSQRAGTLSGGEQKMLVLARCLLAEPALLLLDEISAGLQPAMVDTVERALQWERQQRGTTVLMVEQNIDMALRLVDHAAVMKVGQIVFSGSATAPGLKEALLAQLAP